MVAATGADDDICRSFSTLEFGFGFNNPKFSDRMLRIEVAAEDSQKSEGASSSRVTTVHISSLLLASQSPFFYKMFSNGTKESEQEVVDLTVHATEELALMDLLQFLYKNKLEATTHEDLLKVLILADKYQIDRCVTYCAQTLSSLPMTFEVAMSCINLPSSLLESDDSHLRSLVDAATCLLSKEFLEYREEALELPLESIEKLLSWDSLEVDCEDDVYDFVMEWMSTHRCQNFSSRLFRLIRFQYMSSEKLKCVLQCDELEQGEATKMVVEALLSKFGDDQVLSASSCPKRAYKLLPVAVMTLDRPHKECIVYVECKKEDCDTLTVDDSILTQGFRFGNGSFCLAIYASESDLLGVALIQYGSEPKTDLLTQIALRLRSSSALQKAPWTILEYGEHLSYNIGKYSRYFINDILYIRFTITLLQ